MLEQESFSVLLLFGLGLDCSCLLWRFLVESLQQECHHLESSWLLQVLHFLEQWFHQLHIHRHVALEHLQGCEVSPEQLHHLSVHLLLKFVPQELTFPAIGVQDKHEHTFVFFWTRN